MKRLSAALLFVAVACGDSTLSVSGVSAGCARSADVSGLVATRMLDRAPAAFVPNLGQWDHPAHFVFQSGPMSVFLQDRGWVLNLLDRPPEGKEHETAREHLDPRAAMEKAESERVRGVALRMSFEGDERVPQPVGEGKLPGKHNYFLGNDESRWRTDVPLYSSVLYEGLYPGIDLRVREAEGHPEYDLLLQPGAALARVEVRVEGAQRLRIATDGSLVMETALGGLTQPLPRTWQEAPLGKRREIRCRYVLLGPDRFGFEVAEWDGISLLTIDPGLLWSTFLGASGIDQGTAVAVDAAGVVTVAGSTFSPDFPTSPGVYQAIHGGTIDAFVSRLDPSQTGSAQLVYSTFLGGSNSDEGFALSVAANGVVTVAGETFSSDFPTTAGAYDPTLNGIRSAFVSLLDPSRAGSAQLTYSTFLGGDSADSARALVVDASGVVAVVGWTFSSDFPTTPGAFATTMSGFQDAFVSLLVPLPIGSNGLVYSSFLGGGDFQFANAVSRDASGVITVVGSTASESFPTTAGAFDTTHNGHEDAFVSRLDPAQTGSAQLVYSTFLGGNQRDLAYAVSVDASGVLTIAGDTQTCDAPFPTTPGAYDRVYNGGADVFVCSLDPSQTEAAQLVYSTFLGGAAADVPTALFVDTSGVVTVAGQTSSLAFPTTAGAYAERHNLGFRDGFVSRLDPSRMESAQLVYSTFLGGSGDDFAYLAGAASGEVTVTGFTTSSDFPTTPGAFGTSHNGGFGDAFVGRLDMLPTGVSSYGTTSPGCNGPLAISVTSWPVVGNAAFSISCSNAPPSSTGLFAWGTAPLATPITVLGVSLWVDPATFTVRPVVSNPVGAADVLLPILGNPALAGRSVYVQFFWFRPTASPQCPPSATNALAITFQPQSRR